ncbi:hypothetical protein R1sor_024856 [Riccia sorocarpa]|uniref:Reverse transcriptase domain-containing protein n=1 Tax=Riccia sorocarpa TaxID=122646 RepID=A0ABD3GRM1_9MARC
MYLRNWRPISLMSLAYKIVSKILATRLRRVVAKLVDKEQTGFIEGRNIMDNVVSLKLGQEMTEATGESAIFCKLDFVKAFDRVQHNFLWATLRKMGFAESFIEMVQLLINGRRAKVHTNGLTTKFFTLERGVRQGCPVSPLLFVLSTQPLMRLLREAEQKEDLRGVHIPRGKPLLHRLFANDSGVANAADERNFQNLCRIIERFEGVSGAQLNLSKSVIIPMALRRNPTWLVNTGCKILAEGEEVTYLGCSAGIKTGDSNMLKDLTERSNRKLTHWGNRFLSWSSRVILLKHTLRSIPVYQFLGLSLSGGGYKQLEAAGRDFLWGKTDAGKTRKALVAWNSVTKPYKEGAISTRAGNALVVTRGGSASIKHDDAQRLSYSEQLFTELAQGQGKPHNDEHRNHMEGHQNRADKQRSNLISSPGGGSSDLSKVAIDCKASTYSAIPKLQLEMGTAPRRMERMEETLPILVSTDATRQTPRRPHGKMAYLNVEYNLGGTLAAAVAKGELEQGDSVDLAGSKERFFLWIKGGGNASAFQAVWSDRNKRHFRNQRSKTLLEVVLKQSREEIEASFNPKDSKSEWELKLGVLSEINRLISRAHSHRIRSRNHHAEEPYISLTLASTDEGSTHPTWGDPRDERTEASGTIGNLISALTIADTVRLTDHPSAEDSREQL